MVSAMRALVVVAALLLTGCTSGIIGGGKPTTITCKGKGAVSGPMAFQADCGDGFTFTINVQ